MIEKEKRKEIYRHRLIDYRVQNRLSVIDMAKIFGVTRQTIYNWEAGRTPINGTARLLMDVIGF